MSNKDEEDWHGYLLAVALFVCLATGHLLFEFYYFQTNKFGLRVKTALFSAIYRKVIRIYIYVQSAEKIAIIFILSHQEHMKHPKIWS